MTIWTLEDIIAASGAARRALGRAHGRAKRRMDAAMLADLGDAYQRVAEIESLARDGRQGKYHGRKVEDV